MEIIKHYTNDDITVVWKPAACIHSKICWSKITGLPAVFNPMIRPWVNMANADTASIVAQVQKCPSAALSFFYNDKKDENASVSADAVVETLPNGPLMVYGNITVKDKEGNETMKHKVTAFCRCGASQNKPYCDGSHVKAGFVG